MHKEAGRVVETATEARGARVGRPVLWVLLAGLALVVVLYALIYLIGGGA